MWVTRDRQRPDALGHSDMAQPEKTTLWIRHAQGNPVIAAVAQDRAREAASVSD